MPAGQAVVATQAAATRSSASATLAASAAAPRRARSGLNSGLDLLDCIAACPQGMTLTELAAATGMAKSSAVEPLATLQRRGLIRRLADQRYVVGLRAWEIGSRAGPVEFGRLALPEMAALSQRIDEGVALSLREHDHMVCVQLVDSPNAVRVHASIGDRSPVHAVSAGLAALAALSDQEVCAVLPARLKPMTADTLATRAALLAELARVRERGYAIYRGGWRRDVAGVSAAIRGSASLPVFVLNVAMPAARLTDAWLDAHLAQIRRSATAIERSFARSMAVESPG